MWSGAKECYTLPEFENDALKEEYKKARLAHCLGKLKEVIKEEVD